MSRRRHTKKILRLRTQPDAPKTHGAPREVTTGIEAEELASVAVETAPVAEARNPGHRSNEYEMPVKVDRDFANFDVAPEIQRDPISSIFARYFKLTVALTCFNTVLLAGSSALLLWNARESRASAVQPSPQPAAPPSPQPAAVETVKPTSAPPSAVSPTPPPSAPEKRAPGLGPMLASQPASALAYRTVRGSRPGARGMVPRSMPVSRGEDERSDSSNNIERW